MPQQRALLRSGMNICAVDELEDGAARSFCIREHLEAFIIRQGEHLHAYLNSCPHTGAPLNWLPDQFLDASGSYIQCSGHDALFRIDDGLCVHGPCSGQSLTPLKLTVSAGRICIDEKG
jgi:nitrite reductase/ring-hydroxylating ferredoxin subunit